MESEILVDQKQRINGVFDNILHSRLPSAACVPTGWKKGLSFLFSDECNLIGKELIA